MLIRTKEITRERMCAEIATCQLIRPSRRIAAKETPPAHSAVSTRNRYRAPASIGFVAGRERRNTFHLEVLSLENSPSEKIRVKVMATVRKKGGVRKYRLPGNSQHAR